MSTFAVPVVALTDVIPHPNADRLDVASVGGFQTIVGKGLFQKGDLAIYVPEGALVPPDILEKENLTGKLSGGGKNRVRAMKLRGVLSQGLTLPIADYPQVAPVETDDVAATLGIEKYEPSIPAHLAGQVGALHGYTISYDIENIKRHPHLIQPDEEVVLTEKLHGTYCQIGWCADLEPRSDLFVDGRAFVTSKGIAMNGQYLKNEPANDSNLYVRTALKNRLIERVVDVAKERCATRFYIMGEVFGDVQDLKYGHKQGDTSFRLFDVYFVVDVPGQGRESYYLHADLLEHYAHMLDVQCVPHVARGLWSAIQPRIEDYTRGKSLLAPDQIREGVVIKTAYAREDARHGRMIFKSVSEEYLLRKGNITELA